MAGAIERNAVENLLDVGERGDRHADLPDFVARERMIGVEADLGRQVECDGDAAGRTVVEQIAITLVRIFGRAEARVHLDFPETLPIAAGNEAARPRALAWETDILLVAETFFLQIDRRIDRIDRDAARCFELWLPKVRERVAVRLQPAVIDAP